jgi:hypothetical protein
VRERGGVCELVRVVIQGMVVYALHYGSIAWFQLVWLRLLSLLGSMCEHMTMPRCWYRLLGLHLDIDYAVTAMVWM